MGKKLKGLLFGLFMIVIGLTGIASFLTGSLTKIFGVSSFPIYMLAYFVMLLGFIIIAACFKSWVEESFGVSFN